jgi:hypothetical protein
MIWVSELLLGPQATTSTSSAPAKLHRHGTRHRPDVLVDADVVVFQRVIHQ